MELTGGREKGFLTTAHTTGSIHGTSTPQLVTYNLHQKVKVSIYWPPIKVHYVVCVDGLIQ